MEPSHSITPIILAPALWKYLAVWRPTLPNPCRDILSRETRVERERERERERETENEREI